MTLIPFNYNEQQLRVVEIDGEPWFVLADLCRALDVGNPSMTAQRITAESLSTTEVLDSRGVSHPTNIVDEPGMYEVVFLSRKPEAALFRRWITNEVLPSIRKTGSYSTTPALTDDQIVAQALAITTARVESLTARLAVAEPKAAAFDRWLSSNINYSVGHVAKALSMAGVPMGRTRLFTKMQYLGWIFRNHQSQWEPYQTQIKTERLAVKLGSQLNTRTGEQFATVTVRITPKGAAKLATLLGAMPEAVAEALATTEDEAAA